MYLLFEQCEFSSRIKPLFILLLTIKLVYKTIAYPLRIILTSSKRPITLPSEPLRTNIDYLVINPCNNTPIHSIQSIIFMVRSEEHTSELQSRGHLVCRLLLE